MLAVQQALSSFRNNPSKQPYVQTSSKQVGYKGVVSTMKHGYHANSKVVSTKLVFFVWVSTEE